MAREQRKLAAIVAADVVGYSRLMGRDESGTLARLRKNRSERLEPVLAKYGGRLVKLTGDGALVEFASAVDALSAAIEFQQAMAEANSDQPTDAALVFRMGLHLGDLIVDGDDLYGDGVNVAARLEGEAPAGGIAISRTVHEAVTGRLKATFDDLGSLALKNIERPVQAFSVRWEPSDWQQAVMAEVTVAPAIAPQVPLQLPDKPSIAVLPFQNMSGDPEQEYFADGMVEDIITGLSRFRELFVIARNSSFIYKGKAVDIKQVGRELGVRHVLEGSVRKASGRVRVTAQLIDCETGGHLWAERYDRDLVDIFAVQEEITRSIVARIAPAIEASTIARVRRRAPASLNAHEIAMRGWSEANEAYASSDPAARDRAKSLAQQALELDPDCVFALVTLSWVFWQASFYSQMKQPDMCQPGLDAARRAIELDRFEHRAYTFRGLLYLELLRHDDALADLRHACGLNPSDALALQALAYGELVDGDARLAKEHGLEALRLNPQDPMRHNVTGFLAHACFATEEFDEGLKWVSESQRVRPDFSPAIQAAIKLYVGLGQLDRARAEAERIRTPQLEERIRRGFMMRRRPEDQERALRALRIALGLPEPTPVIEPSPKLALPDKPFIAVLPFQNISGNPENDRVADAITDGLITDLSRQSRLSVVARARSAALKNDPGDAARYLVEGSVQSGSQRVRVNVQMIRAVDGIRLWADRVDKPAGDAFDMQDEIVERISRALAVQVREAEIARAAANPKAPPDAATLIELGRRTFTQGFCRTNGQRAAALYSQALALDDRNAFAHCMLSITRTALHLMNWSETPDHERSEAIRHRDRARELDPGLPWCLVASAWISFGEGKFQAAVAAFERIAQMSPSAGGNAFANLAMAKNFVGRAAEAETELMHAIEVFPGEPQIDVWHYYLGISRIFLTKYREASDVLRIAVSLNPQLDFAYVLLAALYVADGNLETASAAIRQARSLGTQWTVGAVRESVLSGVGVGPDDARMTALWDGLRLAGLPE